MARTKIEVKGFEAKYYDLLMNLITFGYYPFFIRSVVDSLPIERDFLVLDAGSGSGRNASLISGKLEKGRVICLDIGKEFLLTLAKKAKSNKKLLPVKASLKYPLPFKGNSFDLIFMCFVLHGFEHEERIGILKEFYRVLKKGGFFCLVDYNDEIDLKKSSIITKIGFYFECDLASEFITHRWQPVLKSMGFSDFDYRYFFGKNVRLTICKKGG